MPGGRTGRGIEIKAGGHKVVNAGENAGKLRTALKERLSGSADKVDPPPGCRAFVDATPSPDTTFMEAGTAHGYTRNYDHPGIVVSKDAQREIWPLIGHWMSDRTTR